MDQHICDKIGKEKLQDDGIILGLRLLAAVLTGYLHSRHRLAMTWLGLDLGLVCLVTEITVNNFELRSSLFDRFTRRFYIIVEDQECELGLWTGETETAWTYLRLAVWHNISESNSL